jgi:hypothetical protein
MFNPAICCGNMGVLSQRNNSSTAENRSMAFAKHLQPFLEGRPQLAADIYSKLGGQSLFPMLPDHMEGSSI